MKMIDMGFKDKDICSNMLIESSESKNKVRYPSFNLYDNAPGFLADKKVGDKCRIEVEVEIRGKSINEGSNGKRVTVDMNILKMGYIGVGGKKTKEEYLAMDDDEREKYDKEDREIE